MDNLDKNTINKFFRGQRNNNPMNIVCGPNHWQGMKGRQADRNFVQFETMTYGLRAAIILLTKYHRDYALTTVKGIIHRWAPDGGEVEKNYVTYVLNHLWKQDVSATRRDLYHLMQGMCYVESRYVLTETAFDAAMKECPMSVQNYWKGDSV